MFSHIEKQKNPLYFEYSWILATRCPAIRIAEALKNRDVIAALDDPISEAFESIDANADETRTCIVFKGLTNRVLSEKEKELLMEALLYSIVDTAERTLF